MEFPAELSSLREMLGYISSFLRREDCDSNFIGKVELACEEALVNIISHGYDEKSGSIDIECKKNEMREFEVKIVDSGKAFNPNDVETKIDATIPIEKRPIGGLGIYLMKRLSNGIQYERIDNKNCLKMRFKSG